MHSLFKRIIVTILTFEARILLRRTNPTIIAVTGSVGKTTTKDAIYAVLKDHKSTRKSEKSFNSELGVPLTILGLQNAWHNPLLWLKNVADGFMHAVFVRDYPEVLVLEMGVDRPKDMKKFAKWIKPDVVVLTRLPDVPVHVEYFASPEAVIEEKMELVKALKPEGVFVYNNDDEIVRGVVEEVRQRSIGYSRYSQTDVAATQDVVRYDATEFPVGISFTLSHNHEAVTAEINGCVGVQHTYAGAAAAAVASVFDVSLSSVVPALKSLVPPPGRMRIVPGIKQTCIIDDSYNSSPVAAERALLSLKEMRVKGRKIAVLGDMLELGQYSVGAHEELGALVPATADILLTIGVRARKIAEAALEHGMNEQYIYQYDEVGRAGTELQALLQKGDVVLVKASQSIRLEKLVEEVMAEPHRAGDLLVRQSQAWREKH